MRRLFVVAALAGIVVAGWGGTAWAVKAGEFCAKADQGTSTTAENGETVTCKNGPDGRLRWEPGGQVATTQATTARTVATTQATTATTVAQVQAVQATTPTTALPHTGAREDRETIWGFAVLLAGLAAVLWARPRIAAATNGPRFIEQDRIDRAHELLGWSEPWDEHLGKK